jgi:hypothetical protein
MSSRNLSIIVGNITKQIEANSTLRETLNSYKHEFSVDLNSLNEEALYQLDNLIMTVGNPTAGEIARRKQVLHALLKDYVKDLYDSMRKFKGEASLRFSKGSTAESFVVIATGGKKKSGSGNIDVFRSINQVRARKLPGLRDKIHLDVFFADDSESVDKALYGNKYINEYGNEVRSSGLFQLGHDKSGSVSIRRKAEILKKLSSIKGASTALSGIKASKEDRAELKIQVASYAKKEAGNLIKQFTTTLKLNEESAFRNQRDSSREKATLNALSKEVEKYLLKSTNLFTTKSSSSAVEIAVSRLGTAAKNSGAKTSKISKATSSKSQAQSKITGRSSTSAEKESLKGNKLSAPKEEATARPKTNWASLIAIINKRLPEQVANNMGAPGLVYRTGRFANSTRIVNVETTKDGYPSVVFDYQRDPYDVFDRAKGAPPWNTPARDPRTLVDKSVREIVQAMAIGRFYTRRA